MGPRNLLFKQIPDVADAAGIGDHSLKTTGLGPYKNRTPPNESTTHDRV